MHEFTVWAPRAKRMMVAVGEKRFEMERTERRGWWKASVEEAQWGTDYAFLLDEDGKTYPDPRSQWQPHGVHGASRLYDQSAFGWTDQTWQGRVLDSAVLYEMHVGAFSPEGTFDGAIAKLDHLVGLGITHVEVMPVAAFAGDRGWGYDGVFPFAVHEVYGGPDGLKRFVDTCHARGLAVVLDVVYNHFGPVGAYANRFGPYLTDKHWTPWGEAVNLDGGGSDEVRRYFCDNALMWLREFHMDGLRLDAVHEIFDRSAVNFLEQLSAEVAVMGATLGREISLIAESDLNDPRIVRPREAGGYGMDAQWSDDFHHALFTLLHVGDQEKGYYSDFSSFAALVKALKHIFVFDGVYSRFRQHSHGRPVEGLSAHHFIAFIQNHDQVGNRATGERLDHIVGMEKAKVALALVLMAPTIPMLFMGEEFAASTPFLYFADHEEPEMAKAVAEGRRRDFMAFGYEAEDIPNPEDRETFERSKLKWDEVLQCEHGEMLAWCRELIHLRRTTPALNDGDLRHMKLRCDEERRSLEMVRGPVRVLCNLGADEVEFALAEEERMAMASSGGMSAAEGKVMLPGGSLAVVTRAAL